MNMLRKISLQAVVTAFLSVLCLPAALAGIAIEHWTQPSGAQVYLVQSHAIPMVDVQLDFDAGSRRDPARGEVALDENALGEAWADLGANFGGHASSDRMSFALRSLTYPDLLTKALQLAARQLAEPAFPADIWQRERETMIAAIKEANTRPDTLAQRAFDQAVFGTHPYGYDTTEASLQRIDVAHMVALYRQLIQPCRTKVMLVGAVTRAQADALVTQLLARLAEAKASAASSCPALPAVADVAPLTQAGEQRIAFDSAQAHVLLGQPGYKRSDSDFLPCWWATTFWAEVALSRD
jgi:zinc protease